MSLWRSLTSGVRVLFNRRAADQDVADEVQHYLDEAAAAHTSRGLSQPEARRAARLEVGSVASVRDQVRESGWEYAVDTTLADLRYSAGRLRASPGFTLITVLTLALGIGATTAIFSGVRPILFDPLPYPDAGRIAMLWEMRSDGGRNEGTFGMYRALAERARSFDAVAVLRQWRPTITGVGRPEQLAGQRVSASYFRVLGVAPLVGRDFNESDDRLNGPNVVVLSDAVWRRRFGGDPSIVGRQVTLDDTSYSVIGVMPRSFENVLAPSTEVWSLLQYDMSQGRAWGHHLRTIARVRQGVGIDQASQEYGAIGRAVITKQQPATYGHRTDFAATTLQDDVIRGVKPALLAVLGAVILVLVIASVNVTNLLLARGVHRRGEFALRTALGAGRGRLIRQLFTESLVLAAIGGAVGMAVASLGVRALVALSPARLPRVDAIGIDAKLFLFGLSVTTLIGLACGLIPALQASSNDPQRELHIGSPRSAGRHRRIRSALVVVEVALALMLLVSSGLLLRSLERLFAVDAGFDSSRLLTMQVHAAGQKFRDAGEARRFFEQVLQAVREVPGVGEAALTSQLPISGDSDEFGVHFESSLGGFSTFRYAVSPGYVETMRIPLRRGRLLNDRDRSDAPLAALISESLATRKFQSANPLGQRLRIGPTDGPLYTIVGVVGDVKQMSLALSESDAVYTTGTQWPFGDRAMSLVVRTADDAAALAPAIRQAVWSVDKDQPVERIATMDELLAASAAERRFALILFEAFALAALVLAAAGIYGVLAGTVAERTREIGVRAALGATRGNILALVIRQGMALTVCGVGIGLAASAAAGGAIGSLLFEISRLDLPTYLGVIALLGAVGLLACAVPCWRAVRVDPASTLRAE